MRISRKSKLIASGITGAGCAGVAVAAVLLTTSIAGQATVIDGPGTGSGTGGNGGGVSNQVSVDVQANASNGSNLNCSDIAVSSDSSTLTFNPVLTKPKSNGVNASSQPIQGGTCTIAVDVKNTGDVNITVSRATLDVGAPGWEVSDPTGLDQTIAPGKTQRLTAKITATQAAQPGPVSGQLVYSD